VRCDRSLLPINGGLDRFNRVLLDSKERITAFTAVVIVVFLFSRCDIEVVDDIRITPGGVILVTVLIEIMRYH